MIPIISSTFPTLTFVANDEY